MRRRGVQACCAELRVWCGAAGDWAEGEARASARPDEGGEEGGEDGGEDVYGDFEDLETGEALDSVWGGGPRVERVGQKSWLRRRLEGCGSTWV